MRKLQLLFVLLLFSSGALFAQTRVLTGTIKDSVDSAPLSYVTVKVKGKNIAATTGSIIKNGRLFLQSAVFLIF